MTDHVCLTCGADLLAQREDARQSGAESRPGIAEPLLGALESPGGHAVEQFCMALVCLGLPFAFLGILSLSRGEAGSPTWSRIWVMAMVVLATLGWPFGKAVGAALRAPSRPNWGQTLLALSILAAALGIGGRLAAPDLEDVQRLIANGRVLQAPIVQKPTYEDQDEHGRTSVTYSLMVHFTVQGRLITASKRVSRSEYDRASIGSYLPATYLPSDPEIHRLDRVDGTWLVRAWCVWGLAILLLIVTFGLVYLSYLWRGGCGLATLRGGCDP